ncbi:MAG: acyl carrier protein [Butyrivibrio sp.]
MTFEKVRSVLAEHLELEIDEITETTTFEELGADSLDVVEVMMELEDVFGIEIATSEIGASVEDLVAYIDNKINE